MSGRKKFERAFKKAVEAEAARRRLATPIGLRTLTIDFEARTFGFDGETGPPALGRYVAIPLLDTERPLWPRESHAEFYVKRGPAIYPQERLKGPEPRP